MRNAQETTTLEPSAYKNIKGIKTPVKSSDKSKTDLLNLAENNNTGTFYNTKPLV